MFFLCENYIEHNMQTQTTKNLFYAFFMKSVLFYFQIMSICHRKEQKSVIMLKRPFKKFSSHHWIQILETSQI